MKAERRPKSKFGLLNFDSVETLSREEMKKVTGGLRYANLAARLIVKDLTKFFETKDDLLTLSLGSRSDFFSRQI